MVLVLAVEPGDVKKKKKEKFYLGGRTNGSGAVKIARKQSRDKNKQTYACGGGRLDAQ